MSDHRKTVTLTLALDDMTEAQVTEWLAVLSDAEIPLTLSDGLAWYATVLGVVEAA